MTYFNRWDAQNAVRFWMMMYHEGACDACDLNDEDKCLEFLNRHDTRLCLGTIEQDEMRTAEYVFSLLIMCRKYRMYTFGEKFIRRADNSILRVFYYLCECFYIQGVKDYLKYPNYIRMDSFRPVYNAYWELNSTKRNMTKQDVLDNVQRFCYEMRNIVEKSDMDDPVRKSLTPASFDNFTRAIWCLTQPIGTYDFGSRKIRYRMEDDVIEEDLDSNIIQVCDDKK